MSAVRTLFRRKPINAQTPTEGGLPRRLGTFQLAMLGVGATVGTGVFFVMHESVPLAGPAVLVSFLIAAIAAGLSAVCYAEMASAVPISGSTYTYAYVTLGEIVAMGVAACLILEYGVSAAAVASGWSGYLDHLLGALFGFNLPPALTAGPMEGGIINLPAVLLVSMCAVLLVRGTRESAAVNTVMVVIKVAVLLMFAGIAITAFSVDHFAEFAPHGAAGVTAAAGTIFFTFIGLDAVSTAGDEVKDPQRALPRAILIALAVVVAVYLFVAVAAVGAQPWGDFSDPAQQSAGLAVILSDVLGASWPATVLAAGAVVSIFSVTLVILFGQTRILYSIGRDGLIPSAFARVDPRTQTPVFSTVVVSAAVALLAGLVPLTSLWDLVSMGTLVAFIVVSVGVVVLRRTRPDLPRAFKVPGYPVTPALSILACIYLISGLGWSTYVWFGAWIAVVLAFYLLWGRQHSALAKNDVKDAAGA
ncbi:amino acid permease [Microbacterium sp. zg-YB36]|uniref:amino acid permease n=1 Tax=Microbacterium sp. zg-YB36 TaxID=2969407 RepID=UPI00214AFC9C|nr:amino acid permease [Microbacterium sp. zg-YB36]MDL5350047.1 amino acid permease [Microbacterium sp. zg-YB36]